MDLAFDDMYVCMYSGLYLSTIKSPIQLVRQSQHFRLLLITPTVYWKKQRTHNFCWSIPGKKCGRNIARTRPPNGRGIVPPVLSCQRGHFTPGGRGGGHRLVLRVRIHREGVQEPHGSPQQPLPHHSIHHISPMKPFLGPQRQQPYHPLLHQSLSFCRSHYTLTVCSHIFADFSTTVKAILEQNDCASLEAHSVSHGGV
jgi:hypothetical protein